jgi:REP-associated tyrosine transposase
MPDHLHAVVQGLEPTSDLFGFVKLAKQLSGYHAKRRYGIMAWRAGYYERVIRDGEDVCRYIEYIRNNPVRARLVTRPEEYPHLDLALV